MLTLSLNGQMSFPRRRESRQTDNLSKVIVDSRLRGNDRKTTLGGSSLLTARVYSVILISIPAPTNPDHMLLDKLLPNLPLTLSETLIYVVAGIGIILITYAVFLEMERRQDLVMMLGASCLFVYALYTENTIFMIATAGLGIASAIEFGEILFGLHKHSPEDLKKYRLLK